MEKPEIVVSIDSTIASKEITISNKAVPLSNVPALILAGGIGSRMNSNLPKQLLPIFKKKKLIDYPLEVLQNAGIKKIIVSCTKLTEGLIIDYIKKSSFTNFEPLIFAKDKPEGVIPAIKGPVEKFNLMREDLIIMHGDEILLTDLKKMYQFHIENKNPITIYMVSNPDSKNKVFLKTNIKYRVVKIGRYDGDRTLELASEYDFDHTITGLWIINRKYVDLLIKAEGADPFLFEACKRGLLFGYPDHGLFFNCNTPEDIKMAKKIIAEKFSLLKML